MMDQVQTFKPYHISLYLVLFRMWNTNRFENPISISRKETMQLARIGSPNTYTQALKELHRHQFIRYDPSYDKTKGSLIILYRFDTISCTPSVSKMSPSINIQTTHTIEEDEKSISNSKNENMKNNQCSSGGAAHSAERVPPLQHIQIYFQEKGHPKTEAERFFNYYESNGWLIGGKSPMKDWKAAARNWILNIKRFEKKSLDAEHHVLSLPKGSRSTNEVHKKQFHEKHRPYKQSVAERSRSTSLHPTSPPPSSVNYEEPL